MAGKKFTQVLNLPVIDIQEGILVGKVRSMLTDPQATRVLACQVSGKPPLKDLLYHLPFQSIRKIGLDAVVVSSAAVLEPERAQRGTAGRDGEDPGGAVESTGSGAREERGTILMGKKAVSESGRLIGTVKDFSFLEDGSLVSVYLTSGMGDVFIKGERPLAAASVLSVGRDYVVIRGDDAEDIQREPTPFSQIRDRGKDISHSLEVRAIEYALNKPVNRSIHGSGGSLIIAGGQQVTPEIIDTAREEGRLPQVLVAAGVGELVEALDVPREKLDAGSKKLLEFWERIKSRAAADREGADAAEGLDAGTGMGADVNTEDAAEDGGYDGPAETPSFYADTGQDEAYEAGRQAGQQADPRAEKKPADEERELEDFLDELQAFSKTTARKLEKTSYAAMRRYLTGRYASERVLGPGGQVLAEAEQLIDEEVIARAEDFGMLSHLFIGVFKEEVHYRLGNIKDMFSGFFDGKS